MVSNPIRLVAPYRGQVIGISFRYAHNLMLNKSLGKSSLSASSGLDILHNEHRTVGVVHHIVAHAAQQNLLNT